MPNRAFTRRRGRKRGSLRKGRTGRRGRRIAPLRSYGGGPKKKREVTPPTHEEIQEEYQKEMPVYEEDNLPTKSYVRSKRPKPSNVAASPDVFIQPTPNEWLAEYTDYK